MSLKSIEKEIDQFVNDAIQKVSENFGSNVKIERIGTALNDIRLEIAINAEEPTTASAQPGKLDLPSVTLEIDPSGISSIFPDLMQQLMTITSFMSSTTQSSRNEIIYDSLTNAIRILINRYSYNQVITEFNTALENNGIARVTNNFRDIVKNSLSQIIKDLAEYGPDDIPFPEYEKITEADFEPVPENLVTNVPNFYVQRYRKYSEDTYKGYEEWYSKTTEDVVYIKREIGSYYFESMQEEIYGSSEAKLADSLDPYIEDEELVLTVDILNELLKEQEVMIKNMGMEKAAGKGSSANPLSLLEQLLPHVSVVIDTQKIEQLSQSVLNVSGINEAIDEFTENMSMLASMNGMIDEALKLPSNLSELANLNLSNLTDSLNISEIASGLNINLDNINLNIGSELTNAVNQITDSLNISNIASELNINLDIGDIAGELTGAIDQIQTVTQQFESNIQNASRALSETSRLLDNINGKVRFEINVN